MDDGNRDRHEPGVGGHYLVAVSGSGNSEYLIRWTSATARRLGASWGAFHVHGPGSEPDPASLERNLALARSLGAEVFTIPDTDVPGSIIRYARVKQATALVIGKAGEGSSPFLGRRSVMEAVLRESGRLDIIVLRGENPVPARRAGFATLRLPPRAREFALALAVLGGVTALGLLALPALGYRSVSILYLIAIIALPFACGRLAVLVSAAASALLWNFIFIPPQLTFSIASLEDLLMFAAFFLAAFAGGILTSRLKEKEAALSLREGRMTLLYGFTRALARVRGVEGIAGLGASYVAGQLGLELALWLRAAGGGLDFDKGPGGAPGSGFRAEPARTCLATREAVEDGPGFLYLPLGAPDAAIGVIGFAAREGKVPIGEGRELLATLADNIALALERELLQAANEEHKLMEESARLARILLDHVSHELRTPLTTIKGSVSGLLEGDDDPHLRAQLLSETLKAADKLNLLVEDLLSMSRLESGSLRLHPERSSLAELLGAAQAGLQAELRGREVRMDPSCEEAEFEVDPALMVQVFRNILRNFAAYTPPGASLGISARPAGEGLELIFEDDGPGVGERELGSLFDTFYRGSNSGKLQGSGLGLSICRGIVEAHGGAIEARAGSRGGLELRMTTGRRP